ncbi:TIGR04219 family outer membrane beta-barrel protein [Endozoicomonas sp. G2_1]|uniref:TIGR04219 family outer membrane beta-barrel protein n=1 Tax=Endozoicomonas sp. G2_1 TaxID=2821091 RepID=UPI001ADD07B6|nr:TIGR04219 family outer membrane beta-barrel protein [Endozoicomonas sp. G2_1]MBO9489721.1 TIGR04219 family outer membrane beta-barrel protein [Endozoicomonas sp. G2_1]
MKKAVIAAGVASMLSAGVQADVLGVYVGGQYWDVEAEGNFGENPNNLVDFNLEDEKQGSYFIAFEHPVPFIPNVKVASTTLDTIGATQLTQSFDFGGQNFTTNLNADAVFDLSYIDYTFYYELFDNDVLSVDFGLTGRDVDGDVSVTATTTATPPVTLTGREELSQIIPMLYLATNVGIPGTDWNVFAEGNFLSFDDHTLYDYQAGISYELVDNLAVDVNLTLGYRAVKLELDDLDDLYSNIDFKGVFAGFVMHF